jgi:hypothetical protein
MPRLHRLFDWQWFASVVAAGLFGRGVDLVGVSSNRLLLPFDPDGAMRAPYYCSGQLKMRFKSKKRRKPKEEENRRTVKGRWRSGENWNMDIHHVCYPFALNFV